MKGAGPGPAPTAQADAVEREVSARITPSAEFLDRVSRVRAALIERVTAAAKARSSPLTRALVAGSAARGTFLQDRLDVDLFLLFPPDLPRERLREEGLALGRAILSETETRYAEHPYLRGKFEGFTVDAVPGFAITDPSHPLSPVDRTPFHQEYSPLGKPLRSWVRYGSRSSSSDSLGVYGSEARTEGFSGYLVELLVIRFGSLRRLLSPPAIGACPSAWPSPARNPRGFRPTWPSSSPTPSTRTATWRALSRGRTSGSSSSPPGPTSTVRTRGSLKPAGARRSRRRPRSPSSMPGGPTSR